MWGNIPYYREDDKDFRKPNLTSAAVATELIKDLDSAIALLPLTPRNAQSGRATKWTAKAYKGRVQVYAGDFANAVVTLRDNPDLRITVVGTRLFGMAQTSRPEFELNARPDPEPRREPFDVPARLRQRILAVQHALGLSFGAYMNRQ